MDMLRSAALILTSRIRDAGKLNVTFRFCCFTYLSVVHTNTCDQPFDRKGARTPHPRQPAILVLVQSPSCLTKFLPYSIPPKEFSKRGCSPTGSPRPWRILSRSPTEPKPANLFTTTSFFIA